MITNKQRNQLRSKGERIVATAYRTAHSAPSNGELAYRRYCSWCERLDIVPAPINTYESVLFRAPVPICK